jgi:hypothetical protein
MAERSLLFPDVESVVVYTAADIAPGDFVAYPGVLRARWKQPYKPERYERDLRDWLEVVRVEGERIIGTRVNPQDWEVDQEFHVYPVQVRDNGVELVRLRA